MSDFSFTTLGIDKKTNARRGVIHTPHGDIQTPAFVPVGTQATVKSLTPEEIASVGTQMFFVNTYHMAMRPGIEILDQLGGLHSFMDWTGPIITDSGGFQVFSLAKEGNEQPALVKINEEGVQFRSHWDGSYHLFTPECSMEYQWKLGSDIHIVFDDCTPYPVTHEVAKQSMERTHRWAVRSKDAHSKQRTTHAKHPYQALYGSVQGSVYEDLRKQSAQTIVDLHTDGIAIGGVAVGESKTEMTKVLDWVMPNLPSTLPRHLLGVGEIDDIFMLVERGVDTFDCVHPTRIARAGYVYNTDAKKNTTPYIINLNKAIYEKDVRPIDQQCRCYTCTHFSVAYIHHLFKVRELLAYRLATIHNLTFIHTLVGFIRQAIEMDSLLQLKSRWLDS